MLMICTAMSIVHTRIASPYPFWQQDGMRFQKGVERQFGVS